VSVGVLHLFLTLRTSSTQKEDWQKENARGATKKKDAQEHTQLMGRVVYHSYMRIAMAIIFPRYFLLPVCPLPVQHCNPSFLLPVLPLAAKCDYHVMKDA
jgi:hypothetical protein